VSESEAQSSTLPVRRDPDVVPVGSGRERLAVYEQEIVEDLGQAQKRVERAIRRIRQIRDEQAYRHAVPPFGSFDAYLTAREEQFGTTRQRISQLILWLDGRDALAERLSTRVDDRDLVRELAGVEGRARVFLTLPEPEQQIDLGALAAEWKTEHGHVPSVRTLETMKGMVRKEKPALPPSGEGTASDQQSEQESGRPVDTPPAVEGPQQSVPMVDRDFSGRTENCLKEANIQTVAELGQTSEAELVAIRNIDEQSIAEVKENLAGLGQRLSGPSLEWPTEEEERAEEPPQTPAPAAPEPWLRVRMEDQGGTVLWVPDWPEEGTEVERSEWARGFVARLGEEEGLEALDEIARQCLTELLTKGRAETVRSVVEGAANALQGCEVRRDHAAPGPAAPRGRLEGDGHR